MAQTGTVKFFNAMRGFGFVQPADGGEDLFVHANNVQGAPLNDGDQVQFDSVYDDMKGKTRAENVTGGTGDPNRPTGKGMGKGGFGGGKGGWDNGFGGQQGGWGGQQGGFGGGMGGGFGGPPQQQWGGAPQGGFDGGFQQQQGGW